MTESGSREPAEETGEPRAAEPEPPAPAETERAEDVPAGDQPGAGPADEAPGAGGPAPDRGSSIPLAALLASVPASELLGTFCTVLAAKAWEGMGLVPNAMTNKVQKNLDDARMAIDAYAAVLEVLRVRLDPQPRQEMENVLTMLRVNFVDKSGA